MPSPRRFLIAGLQRSGTSVCLGYLAGHPEVAANPEEIHTAFFATAITDAGREDRSRDLAELIDHLAGGPQAAKAVGLKTALPSIEHTARLVGCLATHAPDLDLIVVRRRGLLAQFGSLRLALARGKWHQRSDEPALPNALGTATPQVQITPAELAQHLHVAVACNRLLRSLSGARRVLNLDYDDDICTGAAWPRLCEFLRITDLPPDWLRLRKASPPPADYIRDHDALAALVPQLIEHAEHAPPPSPRCDPRESRLFLLHRAALRLHQQRPAAAIDDALGALHAPADWGVEDHQWACATLRDALFHLGDAERASEVAAHLERALPGDAFGTELVTTIRSHLPRPR